jgi:hypothetical protein
MKGLKAAVGVLGLCITLPIWYYLLHFLLEQNHADRLLWFLYWIYVPVGFLVSAVSVVVDKYIDKK